MRPHLGGAIALLLLAATPASANFTIDLVWADTGTSTLTVVEGDAAAPAAACTGHNYAGSSQNRCLQVVITATDGLYGAVSTLGWDAASSGVALDWLPGRSFGAYGGSPLAPLWPKPALPGTDCGAPCDTYYGSFGGLNTMPAPAGTYLIGSLGLDLSGALAGSHSILHFLRTGIDGVVDDENIVVPVQLNGATLNVIPNPEPATAALLGLGLAMLAARRRR